MMSNPFKRCTLVRQNFYAVLILSFLLLGSQEVLATSQYFRKYVGQGFILPIPSCPVNNGYVNSWSYSCSSTRIRVTNGGSSKPSEAVITSYFDGAETIECFFQYIYMINGIPRSATSREYHRVECYSNDITISGSSNRLKVGEGLQLSYQFNHSAYDATPNVTWNCRSGQASVDYRGYVRALSPGTATITAKSNLGGNTASYDIYIEAIKPTGVEINPSSVTLKIGSTKQLTASLKPTGASSNLTWSSDKTAIATVNMNGLVTAVAAGQTRIYVTTEEGHSAWCTVTVPEPPVAPTSVSIPSKLDVYLGLIYELMPILMPSNAETKLTYSAGNSSVVTLNTVSGVNQPVRINPNQEGTTTLTVKTENGLTAQCEITVAELPYGLNTTKLSSKIRKMRSLIRKTVDAV